MGACKWTELLPNLNALRGYPEKRAKSEVATSPLPSRKPTSRRNCYVTPAFSGVPRKGDKLTTGYLTPTNSAHLWAPVKAEVT